VRGAHDAKTVSETIEENGMVNTALREEEEWRAHYQLRGR